MAADRSVDHVALDGAPIRQDWLSRLPLVLAAVLVAVLVLGVVTTPGALAWINIQAILASAAIVGIVAIGLTPIMLSGSFFSLALGVTLVTCSMLFLSQLDRGIVVATVLALALGGAAGAAQGLIVGGLRANPIIVTIGWASLAQGVAIWLTNGSSVVASGSMKTAQDAFAGHIVGIPVSTVLFLVLALAMQALLRWTRFGRELYLVGSNARAARAAGIATGWTTVRVFAIAGLCCGLAGVLQAANSSTATLGFSTSWDFDAITAVLVGGTSIMGGRGSVLRTVGGTLVLATAADVLVLKGAGLQTQLLVKGLLVLAVVTIVGLVERRNGKEA